MSNETFDETGQPAQDGSETQYHVEHEVTPVDQTDAERAQWAAEHPEAPREYNGEQPENVTTGNDRAHDVVGSTTGHDAFEGTGMDTGTDAPTDAPEPAPGTAGSKFDVVAGGAVQPAQKRARNQPDEAEEDL